MRRRMKRIMFKVRLAYAKLWLICNWKKCMVYSANCMALQFRAFDMNVNHTSMSISVTLPKWLGGGIVDMVMYMHTNGVSIEDGGCLHYTSIVYNDSKRGRND